ncbi:TPA: hypothetical protein MH611_16900, partial [Klebsiella pneumoniae]|nr:hypothetical protein [Klebsiella pneumoniae]
SRHPANRRLLGWGHARRRYACAGLRIQFNGGLQCRLYAGYGVAAIRQTGGSLAVAMPGGATLARAYKSSAMGGLDVICRPGKA